MLLDSRTTRLLLEAAEDVGIPRSTVLEPLGLVQQDVADPKAKVEWTTVATMCDQLSRLVGGDVEQLREIGRRMSKTPAYEPLRRLGRSVVSVRSRRVLSIALEGVHRIRAIVRDLLMLSRGEEGALGPVDARHVAESTLVLAAREIERTARLVQRFDAAPLVYSSDARIAQILLNLVANSLEAMRGQPREDNVLTVNIGSAPDGRLFLDVGDTGCGIRESDLPRLFEPFFTTKPAGQGTGLGLPIVQRLVVEMGGEIAVTSKVRTGTTFRVLLPAVPVTSSPARRSPGERPDATSR